MAQPFGSLDLHDDRLRYPVIGGLFWKPVRWHAVGTLMGLAVLAIVFAGVCLALIAMLSNAEYG